MESACVIQKQQEFSYFAALVDLLLSFPKEERFTGFGIGLAEEASDGS